jgi:hypothetical protein
VEVRFTNSLKALPLDWYGSAVSGSCSPECTTVDAERECACGGARRSIARPSQRARAVLPSRQVMTMFTYRKGFCFLIIRVEIASVM